MRTAFRENKGKIAAVILEPIPANAGLYFPQRRFFLEACATNAPSNGALLIFDEVMTGFRVARGGAQEIYGIRPDLTALGKVIGGGLPVGAFGGRAEIMDQLSPDGPVYQAGTLPEIRWPWPQVWRNCANWSGSMAGNCSRNLARNSKQATRSASRYKVRRHISSHRFDVLLVFRPGPMIDLASAKRSDTKTFARFFHACLERGIYFAPSQFETGFISTAQQPTISSDARSSARSAGDL